MAAGPPVDIHVMAAERVGAVADQDGDRMIVNDMGAKLALAGKCLALHKSGDVNASLNAAKDIIQRRAEQAVKTVWDKFNMEIATQSVAGAGGVLMAVGGGLSFAGPAAPIGWALLGVGTATSLGGGLGALIDTPNKNNAVHAAMSKCFEGHDNELVHAMSLLLEIKQACDGDGVKETQVLSWLDAVFAYYLETKKIEIDPRDVLQQMVDGTLHAARQGYLNQLADACRASDASIVQPGARNILQNVQQFAPAALGVVSGALLWAATIQMHTQMASMLADLSAKGIHVAMAPQALPVAGAGGSVLSAAAGAIGIVAGVMQIVFSIIAIVEACKTKDVLLTKVADVKQKLCDALLALSAIDIPQHFAMFRPIVQAKGN